MRVSYDFRRADQTCLCVTLEIGNPQLMQDFNSWACTIEWSGLDLPGKHGFGADPLGALENTLTIVRSVLDMMTDEWDITPAV